VNQPTPGTPVPLSTNTSQRVSKFYIQMIPGLTGKAYLGSRAMNKTTMAGVARIFAPNPSGGISDQFLVETDDSTDTINLAEYAIDLDVAGEGVLISYWTE
jgi:phosphomannomutase